HIVVAEQLELPPRQERCVAQLEQLRRSVVPAVGAAREREADAPPRRALGEREHGGIVGVQDPDALRRGVVEQQALVVVVGRHGRIAVEVVGREVREDADVGCEVRAVVQLERGHLDGEPVIAVASDGDVGERPTDVANGRRADASLAYTGTPSRASSLVAATPLFPSPTTATTLRRQVAGIISPSAWPARSPRTARPGCRTALRPAAPASRAFRSGGAVAPSG